MNRENLTTRPSTYGTTIQIIAALKILSIITFYISFYAVIQQYGSLVAFAYLLLGTPAVLGIIEREKENNDSPINVNVESTEDEVIVSVPNSSETSVTFGFGSEYNIMDIENRIVNPGENITFTLNSDSISVSGAVTEKVPVDDNYKVIIRENNQKYSDEFAKSKTLYLDQVLKNETDEQDSKTVDSEVVSTTDSGLSPVAGFILGIASLITIILLAVVPLFLIITTPFSFAPYTVPLIGITGGSIVLKGLLKRRFINNSKENRIDITTGVQPTNIDVPFSYVEIEKDSFADFIKTEKYIVAPNNSNPRNWEETTALDSEQNRVKFAFGEAPVSKDGEEFTGRGIFANKEYTTCNATYENIESIQVYDSEYNKIYDIDLTEQSKSSELLNS